MTSSFGTTRSTSSRKIHQGGITQSSEDAGSAVPPLSGTTFHAGLTHFGSNRDHHDSGHKESKGSIVGSSSSIEKALKKARVFLDEKGRTKARATSLWAFL
ncbi:hypothetical protein BGZ65_012867, partial [Modicella reniformis]